MPHLTFQYSANVTNHLDTSAVLESLHYCLGACPFINVQHIKSKKQDFDVVFIANHIEKASFLHCEVALFVGRPATILNSLRQDLLQVLQESASSCPSPCWISVELREIPAGSLVAEIV
ncbi:MAG: hypothetical protein SAK29_00345 [Scytonema sp. PMC 1069.18]|nr:hypothetical protein [Scytonema sp. PMC 1069.18]MEC4880252.1 hypothetical protein [Scytonema sp. PMC 1070.18]